MMHATCKNQMKWSSQIPNIRGKHGVLLHPNKCDLLEHWADLISHIDDYTLGGENKHEEHGNGTSVKESTRVQCSSNRHSILNVHNH